MQIYFFKNLDGHYFLDIQYNGVQFVDFVEHGLWSDYTECPRCRDPIYIVTYYIK